ncbi:MAG TPA: hypothetical protein QF417_03275, partial [Acidimicrobiales bacterium]|nr:hypothetical protein [Acidimicrobiales bacterium]
MSRLRTIATRGDTPVLALSIATGALVALLIAGFEYLAQSVFLERITHRPLYQIAAAPAIGLVL